MHYGEVTKKQALIKTFCEFHIVSVFTIIHTDMNEKRQSYTIFSPRYCNNKNISLIFHNDSLNASQEFLALSVIFTVIISGTQEEFNVFRTS